MGIREAVSSSWRNAAPALVCALLALALRLPGADSEGLEANPDETALLRNVVAMADAGAHPLSFHYPSLWKYLLLPSVADSAARVAGAGAPATFAFALDPDPFFDRARALSALFGAGTVAVVAAAAGRLGGVRAAWIAGPLLAGSPLHVEHSGWGTTDAAATFFVALALLFAGSVATGGGLRAATYAGAAAGLAASTKYPAGFVLLALVAALVERFRLGTPVRFGLAAGLGAAAIAFFVGTPFALLDAPGFRASLASVASGVAGAASPEYEGPSLLFYPWRLFVVGLLPIPTALALVAIARAGSPGEGVARVLLVYAAGFVLAMGAFRGQYERYILPALPALVLLAALGGSWILLRKGRLGAILVVTGVTLTLGSGVVVASQTLRSSTRTVALRWIATHVPPGSRFLKEVQTGAIPSLERLASQLSSPAVRDRARAEALITRANARPLFHVVNLGDDIARYDWSLHAAYAADYVVLASPRADRIGEFRAGRPKPDAFYAEVAARAERVAEFTPDWRRRGPRVSIWRLRTARDAAACRADLEACLAALAR